MKSSEFNLLHLTDLHAGQKQYENYYPLIRDALFQDLEKMREKCGPWDAVIFSGDLAYSGQAVEFQLVDGFIFELQQKLCDLGSQDPIVLAVPGNHDITRPSSALASRIIASTATQSGDISSSIWEEIFLSDSSCNKLISDAFSNYTNWWTQKANQAGKSLYHFSQGLLPGDFCAVLEKDNKKLGIVGLNSTTLQIKEGNFEGLLEIHQKQYYHFVNGKGKNVLEDVDTAILITHQPPDWLSDRNQKDVFYPLIAKSGRFSIHLCGHLHFADMQSVARGGFADRIVSLGRALLAMERTSSGTERLLGYQIVRIEIPPEPDPMAIRMWPRAAVQAQGHDWHYVADNSFRLDDDGGTPPMRRDRSTRRLISHAPSWKSSSGIAPTSRITDEQLSRLKEHLKKQFEDIVDRVENFQVSSGSASRMRVFGWLAVSGFKSDGLIRETTESLPTADPRVSVAELIWKRREIQRFFLDVKSHDFIYQLVSFRFILYCFCAASRVRQFDEAYLLTPLLDGLASPSKDWIGDFSDLDIMVRQLMDGGPEDKTLESCRKILRVAGCSASARNIGLKEIFDDEMSGRHKVARTEKMSDSENDAIITHEITIYFTDSVGDYMFILEKIKQLNINFIRTMSETLVPKRAARAILLVNF